MESPWKAGIIFIVIEFIVVKFLKKRTMKNENPNAFQIHVMQYNIQYRCSLEG